MVKLIDVNKECLYCFKPIEQLPGKRERKYCSDSCRQKAYQTANKVQMVSISKVEYDRLKEAEFELNIIRMLEKKGETAISLVPEGIKIEFKTVLDPIIEKEGKRTGNKVKSNVEAVNVLYSNKTPPPGLSKSEMGKWRRNNS